MLDCNGNPFYEGARVRSVAYWGVGKEGVVLELQGGGPDSMLTVQMDDGDFLYKYPDGLEILDTDALHDCGL